MPNPIVQAIGRVQPIYKGNWVSGTAYKKLDNIYYEGSTYVCTNDITSTTPPNLLPSNWQLVASKGNTGGIGSVVATASALETGSATASVVVSGDDPSAKNFTFSFGLPKGDAGPAGIVTATASASALAAGADPTVTVVLNSAAQNAHFNFGLPAADGQGVALVDNEGPTGSARNVNLTAVRYGVSQTLTNEQQALARQNINAMAAPSSIITGQFIQYDNGYKGATIYTIPVGDAGQVGRYLKKVSHTATASDFIWASVHEVPAGGSNGAILTKTSNADYDVAWESAMTSAEVDAIIGADSSRSST